MKQIILSAVIILSLRSYAAAQNTSSKSTSTKNEKATVKKTTSQKNTAKKTILKQESSATAKNDSLQKIKLPVPKSEFDSTTVPKVKDN